MRRPDGQTVFLGSAVAGALAIVAYLVLFHTDGQAGSARVAPKSLTLRDIPFDGQRAFETLVQLCALGPRPSGSPGMARQQQMLTEHFQSLGGTVIRQQFKARHPADGSPVPMANLVVRWHPDRHQRILLCAHYDTRPLPDRDPDPQKRTGGVFVGANDGASGVAVLAEMARHMPRLASRYGVDFALLDGEEFVFDEDRDPYFLGSEHFARQYVADPSADRYRWAVLLDMVGDKYLNIPRERYSMSWRDSRPLVLAIWDTAARLGVTEFLDHTRFSPIRDDHLLLHEVGKIPACNIIDFDYGPPGSWQSYWHTEADTPDKCSALSLAKVGWVVLEWLKRAN
jgi:glutaminyl-peptide cyclotransferase